MATINQKIIERCLREIKAAIKKKGLNYSDVAELLQVSTVTIKRMLNQKDIGLDRLITLVDIAELNIGELIEQAKSSPERHFLFTDIQDKAFFEHPHLLAYFSELFFFNKTPLEIEKSQELNELSTYLYLRKLEDIGLIELMPENKFRFLVKAPLGFSANSLVLKRDIAFHIQATCDAVIGEEKDDDYFLRVKPIRAPQKFFNQMADELKKVIDRYTEIAEVAYISQPELPAYQVTMVGHPLNADNDKQEAIINIKTF